MIFRATVVKSFRVISGFHRIVNEVFVLLGC